MDINVFIYLFFLLIGIEGSLIVSVILLLTAMRFSAGIIRRTLKVYSFGLFTLSLSLIMQFVSFLFNFELGLSLQIFLLILQILTISFFTYASIAFYIISDEIGFGKIIKSKKLEKIVKK